MDDLVTRLEAIPLSGDDLVMMATKLGNQHTRFYLYNQLKDIKSVDELMAGHNSVFILFDIKSDGGIAPVGHWNVVIRNQHGISVYDPYGLSLGQDLEITGEPPYLTDLLARGPPFEDSMFRHQTFKDETQTCGRHTVARSIFWFMTNAQYNDLVIAPLTKDRIVRDPDAFVSLLTAFLDNGDRVVFEFFVKRVMAPSNTFAPG